MHESLCVRILSTRGAAPPSARATDNTTPRMPGHPAVEAGALGLVLRPSRLVRDTLGHAIRWSEALHPPRPRVIAQQGRQEGQPLARGVQQRFHGSGGGAQQQATRAQRAGGEDEPRARREGQ